MAEKFIKFGSRLEAAIIREGTNVNRLAKEINVDPNTLWNYINKNRTPSATILYNISKELNVSMEYLLTGEEEKTNSRPEYFLSLEEFELKKDKRYTKAQAYLLRIFKSRQEDVKKAIYSNLEVFNGTVTGRENIPLDKAIGDDISK
jgi:transcriptional regulator with XRE-family HTH domain